MPAKAVFLDTWAFLALINRDDAGHKEAVALSHRLRSDRRLLVTTAWVFAEFLNAASRPPLRDVAARSARRAFESPRVEIVRANHDDWRRGFELYERRLDKTWSMTDCISILVCQAKGITDVFTADHRFRQAGLNVLIDGGA